MVYIVVGVLLVLGAPFVYRRRRDPAAQRAAGAARAATAPWASDKPRSPRQLAFTAILSVPLGIALIVYGATKV